MRSCLSCRESQPLTEYAYHGRSLFCDNCRWSGQSSTMRSEAKVIHERNRRKRKRATI